MFLKFHILSWFKSWVHSQMSLKCWKWIFLSLNKINWFDKTKFGTEMEIQHTKPINAKSWQYVYHVLNTHTQHKTIWEG